MHLIYIYVTVFSFLCMYYIDTKSSKLNIYLVKIRIISDICNSFGAEGED